jgi:hypothetical protein
MPPAFSAPRAGVTPEASGHGSSGTFAKQMHFIRYQPLKEKLKTRSLSDREALPYLIVMVGLFAAGYLFPNTETLNTWDWIGGGVSVALSISGVIYAYVRNGGAQGFDLIQKYAVLGWIVTVRCLLTFIPCVVLICIGGEALGVVSEETNWFDVSVIAAFEVLLYQRIGRHISDTK